jgi:apolipoprotein N-acyltransferase
MVADVPLGTTTTPATLLSRGIELLAAGLGLFGLLAAFTGRRNSAPDMRKPLPPVR